MQNAKILNFYKFYAAYCSDAPVLHVVQFNYDLRSNNNRKKKSIESEM